MTSLVELDRQTLWDTFASRTSAGRFFALSADEQSTVVEMNHRYGLWLRGVAEAAGHCWVYSRPWTTLAARSAEALRRWTP